mmetsp:Transcript_119036/g.167323  ORF Transcript_119036/g.167323 Transcript_119036/m.167323 type:complete len:214 (-) Transcript_119036:16-657(-)
MDDNVTIPILYGSRSVPINSGPQDVEQDRSTSENTHNWKVYVQCPCAKDMTKVVRKVVFKLHESFENPNRTCSVPPYEVEESGWGEFEINIKIYFVDQKEKPISFYHLLKLYPVEGQIGAGATVEKNGALYSEFYDEIVFRNESAQMNAALHAFAASGSDDLVHGVINYAEMEREQIASIVDAEKRLGQMISEFKDKQSSLLSLVNKHKLDEY